MTGWHFIFQVHSIDCKNTSLVLKESKQMEGTIKKQTFIFGIVWESMVSIYFLF